MTARSRSHGVLVVSGAALLLHAMHYNFLADDAYIFLRYARNLLDGNGLVYNLGERVEGYSSLLFTLLVAGMGALGVDLVEAARALSLVAAVATIGTAVALARRLTGTAPAFALLPAIVLATNAPFACWAGAGMDETLYACGVALALAWLPARDASVRRRGEYGLLLGVLLLVRSEVVLVIAVALCATTLGRPRTPRRELAALVIPIGALLGALLVFRHTYYGDWLPNTYYAKVGYDLGQLSRGVDYLLDFAQGYGGGALAIVPFVAALWRRDVVWRATAATALLMLAGVVAVGGDGLPMYRFVVPVLPLWSALWAALLADGWRVACDRWPQARVRAGAVVAWVACLVVAVGARPVTADPQYRLMVDQRDRELPDWTAVGRFLRSYARPGESVALAPIGAVGYYSGLRVIDILGLVDRHIAQREMPPTALHWAGHEKHDGRYVLSLRPTFLLLGNVQVLPFALSPDSPNFVQPANPWIEAREGDILAEREILLRDYVPRVVRLENGRFLHFLHRRSDRGQQKPERAGPEPPTPRASLSPVAGRAARETP